MFFPDLIVDKVQDIDLDFLVNKNIKGLLLDIDNTLVPMHMKEADENAVEWIERVKSRGFKVCIVSNASKKRVIKFNEKLKLYAIHRASKPGTKAFKKAMRLLDLKAEETAVVGDQIFTDIFGGNRLNLFTILAKPIHKKETFFIKLKRLPEKLVLALYEKSLENSDKESR
ncbi:MAG TPA: YqeG family HAD IIIA-type phosphatase [Clostridiaceae bacterium]|nr:YqeG family HAD IIIA-type phosphatase [Clostridiaceae bacterium]